MERTLALPPMALQQWVAPALGVAWFGLGQAFFRWPMFGGIAAAAFILVVLVTLRILNHTWPHTWSVVGAVILSMTTVIVTVTFVTSPIARHVIIIMSASLLVALLRITPGTSSGLSGKLMLFAMTVSYWLGLFAFFHINILLSWPVWLLAGMSAVLTTVVAIIVWVDNGVPWTIVWRSVWLAAWLGLELWLAAWSLPTSMLVGSVVVTTVVILWLQVCRHVWLRTWQAERSRRYVFVGSVVVGLTLLTARWV